MQAPQIEVFVNEKETGGEESVGLLIRDACIVDYEEELTPGCLLSVNQARFLASVLMKCAAEIEE